MNRRHHMACGLVVILLLAGCGPRGDSPAQKRAKAIAIIDAERATARPRLERMVEIAEKITPEFKAPAWAEKIDPPPIYYPNDAGWNMAVVGREDLLDMKHVLETGADPQNYLSQVYHGDAARDLWDCADFVAQKEHKVYYDLEEVEHVFRRLQQARYLLVFADPDELVGEADLKNKTFTSGYKAATGFLFDLESGECLGSFRVSAASSESVNIGDGTAVSGSLEGDISGNFVSAMGAELERRFPHPKAKEGEK